MPAVTEVKSKGLGFQIVKRVLPKGVRQTLRRSTQWPEKLRYSLAARSILPSENNRRLQGLHHKHKGQRIFIIGGGPSIRQQNLQLMRDEVTIAFNTFFNTARDLGWMPTYYLVEDPFPAEDNQDDINAVAGTTKVFAYDLRYCLKPGPETIYVHFDRHYAVYPSPAFPRFSSDVSKAVYWGGTVTYMGMQLAYYMGASEVYLLGIDLSFAVPKHDHNTTVLINDQDSHDHAHPNDYGKGKRLRNPMTDRMQCSTEFGAKWMAQHGTPVYNATHGGNLQNVPRREYHELFASTHTTEPESAAQA